MKHSLLLFLTAAALTGFMCQQATAPSATGNEPVKTTISGKVYQRDGATPAEGAMITIHPADMLFFPQEKGLAKTAARCDTILTNGNGSFSVDTLLPPGAYIIEAKLAGDIALIDTVEVKEPGRQITLPQAILKPSGTVKGTVILSGGGDSRDIFVLVYGVDRFTRVQDDCSFTLYNLGEGTYSIRIVSLLEHYGAFDTAGIMVVSADTTELGEIVLPFDGIPVPRNLTADYDTLALEVALRWNSYVATDVKGYVIYRKMADSNLVFSKITPQIVTDTFLTDNTAMPMHRYEYRVAAVGTNDEEGTKSGGVFVTTASFFTVDTVIDLYQVEGQPGKPFAISGNGDYYFSGANCIQVYDRVMALKRQFGEQLLTRCRPNEIKVDENGLVALLCTVPDSVVVHGGTTYIITSHCTIYIFDVSGTIVDSIGDSTSRFSDFDVKDGLVYAADSDSVDIYSYDGTRLRSCAGRVSAIAIGGENRIYGLGYAGGYEVVVFDTAGATLSRFSPPHLSGMDDIEYDAERERLYLISFHDYEVGNALNFRIALQVIDRNNTVIATFYRDLPCVVNGSYSFKLSDNGEVTIIYFWITAVPNEPTTFHKELLRLDPLVTLTGNR